MFSGVKPYACTESLWGQHTNNTSTFVPNWIPAKGKPEYSSLKD